MGYYRKEEKEMKKFVALLLVLVMAFPMQGYASEPKWGGKYLRKMDLVTQ